MDKLTTAHEQGAKVFTLWRVRMARPGGMGAFRLEESTRNEGSG
jgi:hypothetical protein